MLICFERGGSNLFIYISEEVVATCSLELKEVVATCSFVLKEVVATCIFVYIVAAGCWEQRGLVISPQRTSSCRYGHILSGELLKEYSKTFKYMILCKQNQRYLISWPEMIFLNRKFSLKSRKFYSTKLRLRAFRCWSIFHPSPRTAITNDVSAPLTKIPSYATAMGITYPVATLAETEKNDPYRDVGPQPPFFGELSQPFHHVFKCSI